MSTTIDKKAGERMPPKKAGETKWGMPRPVHGGASRGHPPAQGARATSGMSDGASHEKERERGAQTREDREEEGGPRGACTALAQRGDGDMWRRWYGKGGRTVGDTGPV